MRTVVPTTAWPGFAHRETPVALKRFAALHARDVAGQPPSPGPDVAKAERDASAGTKALSSTGHARSGSHGADASAGRAAVHWRVARC
jgi:hypothetical protein